MDGDKKIADVNKETAKGVTELLASNPSYEGASGRTTNYSLPLYERGDNFKILTDQNIAMSIIDTALADNAGEFDTLKNKVATLESNIRQLGNSLDATNNTTTTILSRLQDVEEAVEDIPTIKSDLISQNNLIKTLTNRVLELENERTDVANRLNGHDSEIDHLNKKTKAGYAFKDNVTTGTAILTTRVYGGNPIESSKYLVTISGSSKDAINQTGYIKQWIIDNAVIKAHDMSHVTINTEDVSAFDATALGVAVSANKDSTNGMDVRADIQVNSGTWVLTMTVIPVY